MPLFVSKSSGSYPTENGKTVLLILSPHTLSLILIILYIVTCKRTRRKLNYWRLTWKVHCRLNYIAWRWQIWMAGGERATTRFLSCWINIYGPKNFGSLNSYACEDALASWRTWVLHTYIFLKGRRPNGNLYINNWASRSALIIVNLLVIITSTGKTGTAYSNKQWEQGKCLSAE